MAVHERLLFAPGLRLDAARVDAMAYEVLLRGLRAAVAEGQVVLVRTTLVTVPTDSDTEIGIGLQDGDFLVEDARVFGANVRLVEIEVNHGRQRAAHFIRRAG